ncbi:MAG: hypothetical protein WCQ21_22000 [Verrucomicrobiota bacterium]
MSEIKFACPHCAQHVACDRDYADLCIVCPMCGQPMEVPRLSAADAAHPDMCVVAAIPQPRQRLASRIPTIDLWKEDEWEERYRAAATPPRQTPVWLVSAIGTVIAAAVLKASLAPIWAVALCVLAGTGLSCFFVAKGQTIAGASLGASSGGGLGRVLSIMLHIFLLLLAIPVVALGVLFIGCVACR